MIRFHPSALPAVLLRTWAIFWLLAIPLFHIHPEIDLHQHGSAAHGHAGMIHTVFSGDLDGEYTHEHHPAGVRASRQDGSVQPTAVGLPSWDEHPELGFSLAADSTDRRLHKPSSSTILLLAASIQSQRESSLRCVEREPATLVGPIKRSAVPVRAPPVSLA